MHAMSVTSWVATVYRIFIICSYNPISLAVIIACTWGQKTALGLFLFTTYVYNFHKFYIRPWLDLKVGKRHHQVW